ncbi:hypothetical protein [Vibrio coralliilyticus]|uniref:hypothetical protein n=1 Tax=Vibrio coralliilyticus TaxID=190893 RepID=UPI000BAAA706|nr:hypothetical protein [Vibrio coralliilyticus]NOI57209.1 hypothetical protein [Vibrio coralliilyticus]PAT69977.1 hypothetical protein CKA27_04225 [Vibrio coralliilyticus]
MKEKIYLVIAIALLMFGCATVEVPNIETKAWTDIKDGGRSINGAPCDFPSNGTESIVKLCTAYSFTDFYREKYEELERVSTRTGVSLDSLGFIAGLTGMTAVAFGVHSDVLTASSLALGTALAGKSYMKPEQRALLYISGQERMQCILNTSHHILGSELDVNTAKENKRAINNAIKQLKSISTSEVNVAREYVSGLSDEVVKSRMNTILTTYDEVSENSEAIRLEASRNYTLVTGLGHYIVTKTKDASIKIRKEFAQSRGSFEASYQALQGALNEQIVAKGELSKLDPLFSQISSKQDLDHTQKDDEDQDNKKQVINTLSSIQDKVAVIKESREIFRSDIINYIDVRTALDMCVAI